MKKLVTLAIFCANIGVFSQIKALTEDGKEVILFENSTWRFVNESDSLAMETIGKNEGIFEKSKNSTFLLKSKRLDVGIYINPKKWKVSNKADSPYVEYVFSGTNIDNLTAGFLLTEKVQISSLKNLKDLILTNVQKNADYFRLKTSEYRTVNGLKVLYLRYIANVKGMDFEYAAQYYMDNEGYTGIGGFSPQKNFDSNSEQIQELLNGLWLTQKAEVSEKVEYSAPPPPMRGK